jgi:hypothetical protein
MSEPPKTEGSYSIKTLAYCAGLVVVAYWLPFIYLAIVAPDDNSRGGLLLVWLLPIVLLANLVGLPHALEALRRNSNAETATRKLALLLCGVVLSPLLIIFWGILRNA